MMYFLIEKNGRGFVSQFVQDLKKKRGCLSVVVDGESFLTMCPCFHSELGFRLYETYVQKRKFFFQCSNQRVVVELIPVYRPHTEEEDICELLREVELNRHSFL